jgi:hypothetical protein
MSKKTENLAKLNLDHSVHIAVKYPSFDIISVRIIGTAPLCQCRISEKARDEMLYGMMHPDENKKKKRVPKDLDKEFVDSYYKSTDGHYGIPAGAFRNGMIDSCRLTNLVMTKAKMCFTIIPDGWDPRDRTPLVYLPTAPEKYVAVTRLRKGMGFVTNICARSLWPEWEANVKVHFDTDQFTATDVFNLLTRMGLQIGVGEGRPYSKTSNGIGFGTFKLADVVEEEA